MAPPVVFIAGPRVTLSSPRPELAQVAASGEFECVALTTRRVPLAEGGFVHLLEGRDAHRVYQRAHLAEACVLTCADVGVALDPRQRQLARRSVRSLYKFMAYKACVLSAESVTWREEFAQWRAREDRLEDYRDARCLAFQVFDAPGGVPQLDTVEQRDAFDTGCGSKAERCDLSARVWELNPKAFHGRPPALNVAGHPLPVGMHWDVQARGKGVTTLGNTVEVWKVPRDDYLNVAPNGYLSASSGRSRASRIFPPQGGKS